MMRRKRGPMSQSQRRRVAVLAGCLPPAVYKLYSLLVVLLELGTANAGRVSRCRGLPQRR